MTKLTTSQIDKLAAGKGVRAIAVRNFLGSLGHEGESGRYGAERNLYADAACYKWNCATQNAIRRGIKLFYT